MNEKVILVDENDNEIGIEEKIKAHENGGKLHRAISVVVFNSKGEMMIQKRAQTKYHCPGKWANTCCSHPRPGEPTEKAAARRLMEEMGFSCKLEEKFSIIYRVTFENGLTEYEFDHIFIGKFDGEPKPNPEEVEEWKFINISELSKDIHVNWKNYAPWFLILYEKLKEHRIIT
jgi:isopentenyl-diphosphate delta-isomerase